MTSALADVHRFPIQIDTPTSLLREAMRAYNQRMKEVFLWGIFNSSQNRIDIDIPKHKACPVQTLVFQISRNMTPSGLRESFSLEKCGVYSFTLTLERSGENIKPLRDIDFISGSWPEVKDDESWLIELDSRKFIFQKMTANSAHIEASAENIIYLILDWERLVTQNKKELSNSMTFDFQIVTEGRGGGNFNAQVVATALKSNPEAASYFYKLNEQDVNPDTFLSVYRLWVTQQLQNSMKSALLGWSTNLPK